MNEKTTLIDDEYIEFNSNTIKSNSDDLNEHTISKLEDNFGPKCSITSVPTIVNNTIITTNNTSTTSHNTTINTNDYCKSHLTDEQNEIEGDDEKTDDDQSSQLNVNSTPTAQRRRRKSSSRSKLNKILTSSSLTFKNSMTNACKTSDINSQTEPEDAPKSSSCNSLSSWIHLPDREQVSSSAAVTIPTSYGHQLSNKSKLLAKEFNSSYDTISEEEHRARARKRNPCSIDDDIVSSNVSSNDDLPCDANLSFRTDVTNTMVKQVDQKTEKKSKPSQSCDSLSSSPTNVSYDSSSPVKSSNHLNHSTHNKFTMMNGHAGAHNQHVLNQNKENQIMFNNLANGRTHYHHYQNHHQQMLMTMNQQSNGATHRKYSNSSTRLNANNAQSVHYQSESGSCLNDQHSNSITLEQEPNIPWLYNSITREDADKFLNKFLNVDGVFLVRNSSKNPENYVLSFVHDRRVKHCHIRKLDVDSTVCFSIDDGKMKFYDLKQLIEFYQLNIYFLPTKLKYFLVHGSK